MLGVSQALALTGPFLFGKVLNAMEVRSPIEDIVLLIGVTLLAWLIAMRLQSFKDEYELRHVDFGVWSHLTQKTLSKILGLSIGQHRSQNSGITQSVVSKGQSSLEQMTWLLLYNIFPIVAEVIVTVGLLLWFNALIGAVVLVGVGSWVWLTLWYNARLWPQIRENIDLGHKTSKRYTEILRNTSLVQSNSQEERVQGEQKGRMDVWVEKGQGIWIPFNAFAWNKQLILTMTRFSVICIGAYLVYTRGYRLGDFVIVWAWASQATNGVSGIGRFQRQCLMLWGEVKKYLAILSVEPAIKIVPNPVRIERLHGSVEFRNVSFTYPNQRYVEADEDEGEIQDSKAPKPALVDVSFSISPGERVAFVGESGAGKSTIINLILRGYDPDAGQILIDGDDLRLLDLGNFRKQVGLVEQNVTLFDNTLRYNTLFGLNGRAGSITDSDLEKVSAQARIDAFSHRLTSGWDTQIGENGLKLSGGERQRVGIARALIKDARMLIFDEATSNIDAKNERLIKEAIHNASEGRTTIIIAHRLSTVRDVDKIFVMDKGRIIAEGQHDELCLSSDIYRELVESQLVHL